MNATLRGLLIGALGGFGFWVLGLPAPWLAGSMIICVIAVFSRAKIELPRWLQAAAFIFLGLQTGTAVSPETLERAAHWPFSIAFLGVTVVAVTWASMAYYRRVRHWDGATALFASLPGALSLVLMLATESKADMRRVTISQCIRLFFLVAMLPLLISQMSSPPALPAETGTASVTDIVLMVVVAVASGLLFERLRVPGGLIIGPTLAGAALELSGLVGGPAPALLLIPANVVLGVMIAARFNNFSFGEFLEALAEGFTGFLIALGVAALGAAIVSFAAGLPYPLTLLAFSPGGLDAMTIMAFSLNLDPAYVGAHQIARYLGLALTMPLITGFILKRMTAGRPEDR